MTVEGIEKSTRAKSTFDTHQNENTRFIVWLFYNYERLIHDELSRASHDFIETQCAFTVLCTPGETWVQGGLKVYRYSGLHHDNRASFAH